jgi:hypothetical protein
MKSLIASNKPKEAQQVAAIFQGKVAKSLGGKPGFARGRGAGARQAQGLHGIAFGLWRSGQDDGRVARARRAGKFGKALPERSPNSTTRRSARSPSSSILSGEKSRRRPFALALVAGRLKTPRELVRLATKAARSRRAADVAATPYAIAVSMVLDQIDDQRVTLLIALKKNRIIVARDILVEIDKTESALWAGIRELDASEWGKRLREIRSSIVELVTAEVSRFPEEVGHVLKLRDLQGNGILTDLIGKGRDAAFFCKRLIS